MMKFLRFGVLVVLSGCSSVEYRFVPVAVPPPAPVVSVPVDAGPAKPAGELLPPPAGSSPFKG